MIPLPTSDELKNQVLTTLQWSFIFTGALLVWRPGWRVASFAALSLGYGLAAGNGMLGPQAAIAIVVLAGAAYLVLSERTVLHPALPHVIVLALAAPLFLHLLPGFHNLAAIGPERLTPNAVPYRMYLNLDKPLILFWLLLVCPQPTLSARPPRISLSIGVAVCAATAIACLAIALWLGLVGWSPKWPEWGWLWAINNLLLAVPAEEALFRGYIQAGIARMLAGTSYGAAAAVVIVAALFGLTHFPGGWELVLLSGVAAIGYGVAYRYGGLLAAVGAHFGLNLVHFGLFTYPMLAR
jgi:membrane protease YdiL (CAAX protease family)